MRPTLTAVIAAIEAVAVALAGLAVIAIPALLLWFIGFDMAAEPLDVAGGAAGVWLLAHFVPLGFDLPAEAALALGLAPEPLAFTLSLAPLGLTLITVVLAARSGWRFAQRGGVGIAGVIGGAAGFAAVAALVAPLASAWVAWPTWLAIVVPALCFAVPSLGGFLVRAARDEHPWWSATIRWKQRSLERFGVAGTAALPARLGETIRLAAALLAVFVGLSALAVAVAIVAGYVSITTLTQSLQLDALGALLVFLLQAALLPTAVVWGGSWLTGAGFAVGAGSSASPFGALLGPLPALPLFGAIPQGWGSAGVLAPALLVLGGLCIGVLFARRPELRRASWPVALTVGIGAAVLAGVTIAAVAGLATGSIGPDRLALVGPDPWVTGGLAAGELGLGALAGILASRVDTSRVRASVADLVPERTRSSAEIHDPADAHETVEIHEAVEIHETVEIVGTLDGSEHVEIHEHIEIHETVEIRETVEVPEVSESVDPAPPAAADESDDELLRAFAWDGTEAVDPEPPTQTRRPGWRLPRRER